MTDSLLHLNCLVDGEHASFPVEIESTETIGELKKAIKLKLEKSPELDVIAADRLPVWLVSVPDKGVRVDLDSVTKKEKLAVESAKLFNIIDSELPEKIIHIIVQRPPQGNTDAP